MTSIGILGSGRVATALASKLASGGHDVTVGSRTPAATAGTWTGPAVRHADHARTARDAYRRCGLTTPLTPTPTPQRDSKDTGDNMTQEIPTMTTHVTSTLETGATATATATATADDPTLLATVVDAIHDAGARLLALYAPDARPTDRGAMFAVGRRNEEASFDILRAALTEAHPDARWVDDDQETSALPPGDWWAVDAAEGNVNHVHGLPEWCVSVTLLRDNTPVLAAVYQPIGDLTYTAIRGAGAHLNGRPLRASAKSDLAAAIVATGQAEAGQDGAYRRISDSITAMLRRALLVRASVPSTFPLLLVAGGQVDVFWQYEPVLPGIAAGALLVTEAGGIVSDVRGQPWRPGSPDILAAAPTLHSAAIDALSTVA